MDLLVANKYGKVVSARNLDHAKATTTANPKSGNLYGNWSGSDQFYQQLPGGSILQFDLTKLTLADYRAMRDHYQINASLSVLSFILHQIQWSIECDDVEIKTVIEENLRERWTTLVRAMSQAFWAGYSPNVLEYANVGGYTLVKRIKDLVPEECRVNWREELGYAPPGYQPPKFLEYDGIRQLSYRSVNADGFFVSGGDKWAIPPENTLWYPLMMENGDYYGRKLLRPAFPAWFFSTIIHLYANRYLERFGEPQAVGRAPFDDQIDQPDGTTRPARDVMEDILMGMRNRSAVTLPSGRDMKGEYEWDIKFLESQMRGADFERYLSRLDEEMSLGVFTPVLLFRTADVGSYNLGQAHLKVFLWMLNAIAGDLKFYIQHYVVDRLAALNFGANAPKVQWVYRKLGNDDAETFRGMLMELVRTGRVMPDLDELSSAVGLTMTEREILTTPPAQPGQDPTQDIDPKEGDPQPSVVATNPSSPLKVYGAIGPAVERAWRTAVNGKRPTLGHRNAFEAAMVEAGADRTTATELYDSLAGSTQTFIDSTYDCLPPEDFKTYLGNFVRAEVGRLCSP